MSHKKRASFALKSMGAAGLVAATIASGLSFGPAAVAADSPPKTADSVGRSIGINARYALTPTNYGVSGIDENGFTLYGTPRVTADSPRPPIEAQGIINGRRYGMKYTQWPAGVRPGDSVSVVFATLAFSSAGTGETETSDGSSPITITRPGTASAALNASVTQVNNIAKSAVISGTATPNGTVTIGSKVANVSSSGAWSMTVTGLANGVNDLVAIQKIDGTEYDRKTVTATIVEGGTLVGIDQGPIELERGESTQVPFVLENREAREAAKGTVTLDAPAGTTFDDQTTVQGAWRTVGNTGWSSSTSIPLTAGRVSNEGKTITFDADWAGTRPANQQYRFMVGVTASDDAPAGSDAMEFSMPGTSSKGDFKAEGKTTTTIDALAAADIVATTPTANAGAVSSKGTAKVQAAEVKGPMTLVAPTGTTFAEVAARHVRDDLEQANYRISFNADRTVATIDGPADGSSAFWGTDNQYVDYTLNIPASAAPGTISGGTAKVAVNGNTLAEGSFGVTVEAASSELAPITLSGPASVIPGRSNTFTGTAEPGATFRVLNVSGTQIVPGTFEVGADGRWSFNRVVSNGAPNFRFVIEQTKNGQTVKSELFTVDATALAPITLSGPAAVRPGVSNTFTGKAEPGATFRVLNLSGTQIVPGTFEVDAQGNWTFNRVVSNGASNFRFVIEQTKNGQTAKSELFTVNAAALTPVTVTTPERVTPGRSNTFTGTGEPGATFRVLNVSGTQIVPGVHEVDAQGNWTFDRVVSNGASNFRFVIEQTKNGQTEKSQLFTINAADFAPVTVATRAVTPGVVNTFTGTGEPGASYRVLNITGTQIVPGTFEVDAQGNWTFNRAVSRGATEFRFALEQTKNGKTELSELFTLPADTK
jgi:hypothetical protein